VLVWELMSGRIAKFFCDEHSQNASPQRYRLAKLIDRHEHTKAAPEEE
jgi:hypothetical protein